MPKILISAGAVVVLAVSLSAWAAGSGGTMVWKGYVTDTYCGLNRVRKAPTAECTVSCVKDRHAKYAFFNIADKKVYILNPQSLAAKYAGQTVVVRGTVGGQEQFQTMKGPGTGAIITASSITAEQTK
ncbi:MAG: hypothetical protein ACRD3D_02165 [Terriglobia bacterium]